LDQSLGSFNINFRIFLRQFKYFHFQLHANSFYSSLSLWAWREKLRPSGRATLPQLAASTLSLKMNYRKNKNAPSVCSPCGILYRQYVVIAFVKVACWSHSGVHLGLSRVLNTENITEINAWVPLPQACIYAKSIV